MDINKVITELRGQRNQIDIAILALERLNAGKKRGRPPKYLTATKSAIIKSQKMIPVAKMAAGA